MTDQTHRSSPEQVKKFEEALRALELDRILGSDVSPDSRERMPLWGLALSGGGIRSATYCLGVLQALAKREMLGAFHYCSTVSGGGYIGGFLQAMLDKHKKDPDPVGVVMESLLGPRQDDAGGPSHRVGHLESSAASSTVKKLRSYSNFLSPNKRPLSGDRIALITTYLSNMLLTQLQLGALILFLAFLPYALIACLQIAAKAPLLTWLVAVLTIVVALAARPRRSVSPTLEEARSGPFSFMGASAIPPAGLTLAFILLAGVIWPIPAQIDTPGRTEAIARFMETLSLYLGHPFDEKEVWFARLALGGAYLVGFLTWLLWWRKDAREERHYGSRLARQLIFGPLAAIAVGASAQLLLMIEDEKWKILLEYLAMSGKGEFSLSFIKVAVGTPLLFVLFFTINLVHLALAYDRADIVSRERWNRLMGRTAVWVVAGVLGGLLITYLLPALILQKSPSLFDVKTGIATTLWGAISVGGAIAGYWEQMSRVSRGWSAVVKRLVLALALWVFLGGFVIAVGVLLIWESNSLTNNGIVPGKFFLWAAIPLIAWYLLARFVDENEFSMNGFYRNRLVRCYLAARNNGEVKRDQETGLNPVADDISLNVLRDFEEERRSQRPLYPLICGAVNLVRSGRLEWQDRKAASFIFSPLFCGHQPLGDGQTGPIGDRQKPPNQSGCQSSLEKSDLAARHTLGAAMAVSGAAVSSNMGYHSSPAVSALLTLFNVRLGWWIENNNAKERAIDFAGLNLLSELCSNTHENGKYAYITDGGHFENLGIYELVRRGCRFILAVDATADHKRGFGDLANAVHKCRVDFGAEIDIDTSLMKTIGSNGFVSRCAALGRITYGDGDEGLLLYIKPSLVGDESTDIRTYATLHEKFPHEPTSDQFFDETQFECYRQLGFQNMLSVIERAILCGGQISSVASTSAAHQPGVRGPRLSLTSRTDKEEFLKRLKYRLYEPSDAVSLKRSQNGDALIKLLERLRESQVLKSLDTQLYPGLHRFAPPPAAGRRPANLSMNLPSYNEFRDCFYYMQELMQLMEGVHTDLDLERNWNHPDNRGWMNLFQHWSWVPIFRLTWALTLQTRGSRFVHFCERRLEIPRINHFVKLELLSTQTRQMGSKGWLRRFLVAARGFHRRGKINFLECALLCSPTVMRTVGDSSSYWLGIATIKMGEFLAEGGSTSNVVDELPVGIVLMTRENTSTTAWSIKIFRIQDHLRRMGIGLAVMQSLLQQATIEQKPVRTISGDCGGVLGKVSDIAAAKHDKRITRFINQVR
ncbi:MULTISPECIES: hypothetical protein [unclassified Pseudoxanthomonas]|uniref:hypothetical protein n=1 Tax=unclassified Pseudoxanthomonas TaxID=2645906 RepID=UPI00307F21D1